MTAKIELLQREIVALSHASRRIKSGGIILMTESIATDMLNRFVELRDKLIAEEKAKQIPGKKPEDFSFGLALALLKNGHRVARRGWNGRGIFIELQSPDEHSKMTSPYIFIDTTGLQTENQDAPKSRVPWLASQTDMLAEDWVMV